ncbi:MAG: glycoside hydrolase family protein [Clostridiales bacterium]|nr:glycoside hydrolase family protein [Clostridiales bacterium]
MRDTINAAGLALIKKFEGCKLTAYQDSAGVWTIGYGHTGKVDGKAVCKGMTITQSKANSLLTSDVAKFWAYANNSAYVPLTASMNENQRSALTSFAFNCGQSNLKTLCSDRTIAEIAEAMLLYNKAGGKVLSGLVGRRKAEQELYLTEVTKDMSTLQKGDEGQQVIVLQIFLNTAIQRNLDTDGVFGTKTQTAVENYQTEKGLDSDGICGPLTWAALLADCG